MVRPRPLPCGGAYQRLYEYEFRPFEVFDVPIGKDLTALNANGVELLKASVASDDGGAVLNTSGGGLYQKSVGIELSEPGCCKCRGAGSQRVSGQRCGAAQDRNGAAGEGKDSAETAAGGGDWEGQNVELPSDVVNQARAEGILGLASSRPGRTVQDVDSHTDASVPQRPIRISIREPACRKEKRSRPAYRETACF